jgi:hypothetical protein
MAVDRLEEQRFWMNLHPNVKRRVLEMKNNLRIVDGRIYTENGSDVTHMFDVVLKTTESQIRGLNAVSNLADHERDHGGFVFAFFRVCQTMEEQFPALSQSDLARLMFIGTFAGWEDGKLKHDNGVPITKKALAELLDVSRSAFNDFYGKLISEQILTEREDGLYISTGLFYRGELSEASELAKSVQYTRLFRKTVRELYQKYNGRSIKQLALIYAVLPFVNFNYNVICFNPQEHNADLVRPMTLENLAALLGYKKTEKLAEALRKLKYNGKPVFGFFEVDGDRRKKKVVVNPAVIYAGDGKTLEAVKILFK